MTTGRMRALVVEDEWAAQGYLVELLEQSGSVEVIGPAVSAAAARDVLRSRERWIDVAFVGVQLAGGEVENDGLELVRSCCGAPGTPTFVLATAFAQHALAAFELGAVDYLLKPFTVDWVAQCLECVRARRAPAVGEQGSRAHRRSPPASARVLRLDEVWAFEAPGRLVFVRSGYDFRARPTK